jgi:hypothetical protein
MTIDFKHLLTGPVSNYERDDLNLAALLSRAPLLSDATFWDQVHTVFRCMASPFRRLDVWRAVFRCGRPGREAMTAPSDRKSLSALPDVFTVYRGVSDPSYVPGMNWTLNRGIAEYYARANAKGHVVSPLLVTARVRRADVLLYFRTDVASQRFGDEAEVVALPETVEIVSVEDIGHERARGRVGNSGRS